MLDKYCKTTPVHRKLVVVQKMYHENAKQFLDAVKNNKIEKIKELGDSEIVLEHKFEFGRTAFVTACSLYSETLNEETLKTLIDCNVNVHASEEADLLYTGLHFLIWKKRLDLAKCLIERKPEVVNDVTFEEQNALHILVNYSEQFTQFELTDFTKFLLDRNVDVNQFDIFARSAICFAAEKGLGTIVNEILSNRSNVDLDQISKKGKSARTLIEEKNLCKNRPLPISPVSLPDKTLLKLYITREEIDKFKNLFNTLDDILKSRDLSTELFEWCCCINSIEIAKFLLSNNCNPFAKPPKTQRINFIELAAHYECFEIVKLLIDKYYEKNASEIIPGKFLTYLSQYVDNEGAKSCLDHIFQTKHGNLIDIKYSDPILSCNCLHYFVRYGSRQHQFEALSRGFSLAQKNTNEVMPLYEIDLDILKEHFDNCFTFPNKNEYFWKRELEVEINYNNFLLPSDRNDNKDAEKNANNVNFLPKMNLINEMRKSPEQEHLLIHPISTIFVLLKYNQLRWLYRLNLIFYFTFMIFINVFSLSSYTNCFNNQTNDLLCILKIFLVIYFLRELFQLIMALELYFAFIENYLQLLIILIIFLLNFNLEINKQLSSFCIIFVAFEFILLLSQNPKMSVTIEILKKVCYTYIKIMFWCFLIYIGFVLSFHMMFQNNGNFQIPSNATFKVLDMAIGELNAKDNDYSLPSSYLLFILFIFLVCVILINMLHAFAVYDVQDIRKKVRLTMYKNRIKFLHYIESLLSNKNSTFFMPKILKCSFIDHKSVVRIFINENGTISKKSKYEQKCGFEGNGLTILKNFIQKFLVWLDGLQVDEETFQELFRIKLLTK